MTSKTRYPSRSAPRPRTGRAAGRPAPRAPVPRASRLPGGRPASGAGSGRGRGNERRPYFVALAALLAAATALVGYLVVNQPANTSAECVVAVDAQGSTRPMLDTYRSWLPTEIKDCAKADHARIDVVLINGDTSTGRTMPVMLDLSKLSYSGNGPDDSKMLDDRLKDFAQHAADVIFQAPPSLNGTDLTAIGCVASPLLKQHKKATLIIDSDAINNRSPYNFGFIPLDDQHITAYLQDLQQVGQICDLSGVTVEWYGAGIGGGTSRFSLDTLNQVKRFWTSYFGACGTTLSVYQRSI